MGLCHELNQPDLLVLTSWLQLTTVGFFGVDNAAGAVVVGQRSVGGGRHCCSAAHQHLCVSRDVRIVACSLGRVSRIGVGVSVGSDARYRGRRCLSPSSAPGVDAQAPILFERLHGRICARRRMGVSPVGGCGAGGCCGISGDQRGVCMAVVAAKAHWGVEDPPGGRSVGAGRCFGSVIARGGIRSYSGRIRRLSFPVAGS